MGRGNKTIKQSRLFKNFLTRAYVFLLLLATNKDGFVDRLNGLRKKFNLNPEVDKNAGDLAYSFTNQVNIFQESLRYIYDWPPAKGTEFFNEVDGFLLKYNLGAEWRLTIIAFLVRNYLCPPVQNLHIGDVGNEFKKKRVVLILNPDTTLEDIKEQMDIISPKQKELWPDFKKTSLRETTFPNLRKYFRTEKGRHNLTDEEKYPGLSYYEMIMAKSGKYDDVINARKNSKEKTKKLKVRQKKTYFDLVKETTHTKKIKNIEKEANKLSQLKRRIAKKI